MKPYRNPLSYIKHPLELATLALGILSQTKGAQGTSRASLSPASAPALAPIHASPTLAPAQDAYCQADRQINANWVDACQTFKVRPDAPSKAFPYAGPRMILSYGTSETAPCALASVTALQPDSQPDVPTPTQANYPAVSHDLLNTNGIEFDAKCEELRTNVAGGCAAPVDMC